MIPKHHYYDPAIFDLEMEKIFFKSWIFACMTDDVANPNDFITFEIGGRPIVIQNFNGQLSAFDNICSHRFSKIQIEEKGNRSFFCPYHGWAYNKEGSLAGIPKKKTFDFPEDTTCFHLKKHKLEVCGRFVFINMNNEDNNGLADFLGVFYSYILNISEHLGSIRYSNNIPHKANWKLLIENVLEGYHCLLVHPETLYKSGFCNTPSENLVFDNGHSKWDSPKKNSEFVQKKQTKLSFLDNRTLIHDSFHHIFTQPNLFFSSTEGQTFYIGQNIPISATQSLLRIWFFNPLFITPIADAKTSFFEAFMSLGVESGIKVIKEDKHILENIQNSIPYANSSGILSKEELRITDFFTHYNKIINQ